MLIARYYYLAASLHSLQGLDRYVVFIPEWQILISSLHNIILFPFGFSLSAEHGSYVQSRLFISIQLFPFWLFSIPSFCSSINSFPNFTVLGNEFH
jgi:hypothetical protein